MKKITILSLFVGSLIQASDRPSSVTSDIGLSPRLGLACLSGLLSGVNYYRKPWATAATLFTVGGLRIARDHNSAQDVAHDVQDLAVATGCAVLGGYIKARLDGRHEAREALKELEDKISSIRSQLEKIDSSLTEAATLEEVAAQKSKTKERKLERTLREDTKLFYQGWDACTSFYLSEFRANPSKQRGQKLAEGVAKQRECLLPFITARLKEKLTERQYYNQQQQ